MRNLLLIPMIGVLSLFATQPLQAGGSQPRPNTEYKVLLYTGNVKSAGTDAKVSVTLSGTKGSYSFSLDGAPRKRSAMQTVGSAVRTVLTMRSRKRYSCFEKGGASGSILRIPSLGKIKSILVSHNNRGSKAGWYLSHVNVFTGPRNNGKLVVFPCNRWLARSADDGQISRHLYPEDSLIHYVLKVHTGSIKKAGTDARVRVDIAGTTNVEISSWQLSCPGDPFEKGQINTFHIYSKSIGNLKTLRVAQDGTGSGSGWYLKKIDIYRADRPSKRWHFNYDRWLDSKHGCFAIAKAK